MVLCEKCQALNSLTFKNTDEIPDKPHPNCRCWVEVLDSNNPNNYTCYPISADVSEEELCDCWKFFDEIKEIIGDIDSLEDEIKAEQNDTIDFVNTLSEGIKKMPKMRYISFWIVFMQ